MGHPAFPGDTLDSFLIIGQAGSDVKGKSLTSVFFILGLFWSEVCHASGGPVFSLRERKDRGEKSALGVTGVYRVGLQ